MQQDYLTWLLGFQGFRVTKMERIPDTHSHSRVKIHLERTLKGYICGGCGRRVSRGYDHTWQELHHLTLWHHHTVLRFQRFRVDCPHCGVQTEALEFADIRGPRVTRMLAGLISELCKVMTVKAVATFQALHPQTIRNIDKSALEKVQAERPLAGITVLGADEISVGKGHNYWTLFSALEGPRGPEMLNIVAGRSERKLKKFWRWFGKDRTARITHAVIDMSRSFEKSFRAH